MEDRRNQIPIGCSVNVAIIGQLQSTDVFKQKCIQVPAMMGIQPPVPGEPWPFFNLSWGAYLMYCFIVVPKELYNLPNEDEFYVRLKKENVMEAFTVKKEKKTFQDDPSYYFRSLRNAISHVNYNIDSSDEFTLWDHPIGKPEKQFWHWEVSINHNDTTPFFAKVADATIQVYNEIKNGKRNHDGLII
ncbi:hypothetical protein KA005_59625 [bacterium]|nr:hypothetical protein [bacterium]